MLKIEEIIKYYPQKLHIYKQFIFKEYLQYLILKIIYESDYGQKLIFLGGTNLRIVYDNQRFSEDLDFYNIGLSYEDFEKLSILVKFELEKQGLEVEIKNVCKGAYRCNVRIPKIMKELGFSSLSDEKILIQIDTAPHDFLYEPQIKILNKFGLVFPIKTTPIDIIASQKIYAIFNRNRAKGRQGELGLPKREYPGVDFYDLVFLLSKTKPNLPYLKEKLGFIDYETTKNQLLAFCNKLDFDELLKDVEIFIFDEVGKNNVKYFKQIIEDTL